MTTYKLVLVESTTKCASIERYLGRGFKCIATQGHIRELKYIEDDKANVRTKPLCPSFPVHFANCDDKIKRLRPFIKAASEIYLGTDDDREGEAIAWHLCQVFKLDVVVTKRLRFHEISADALQRALKSADSNESMVDLNLVNAQLARQVLDLLIGFRISPLLWGTYEKQKLSAGRCQTPTLKLIYDKQKEHDAYMTKLNPGSQDECPMIEPFKFTAYFTSKNIPFTLNWREMYGGYTIHDFLKANHSQTHQLVETPIVTRQTVKPPQPWNTCDLLKHNPTIQAKDIMQQSQQLFEKGYITYHRTTSRSYSETFLLTVGKFIKKNYGDEFAQMNNPHQDQDQHAHEAIRVTSLHVTTLDDDEVDLQNLYALIYNNTLTSCMTPAILQTTAHHVTTPVENVYFRHAFTDVVFPGWKKVNTNLQTITHAAYLTSFLGKPIRWTKIVAKQDVEAYIQPLEEDNDGDNYYQETCPRLHSTTTLLQQMEHYGIGRPSTYASLLDKLQERKYADIKKIIPGKSFHCLTLEMENVSPVKINSTWEDRIIGTQKNKWLVGKIGEQVLNELYKKEATANLFEFAYTKEMELMLDDVAAGKSDWQSECLKINKMLDVIVGPKKEEPVHVEPAALEKDEKILRVVNEEMSIRQGPYGHYIFYKLKKMKKPKFLALDFFSTIENYYLNCPLTELVEAIELHYKIKIKF
jgi:DNA topoisomerase-1